MAIIRSSSPSGFSFILIAIISSALCYNLKPTTLHFSALIGVKKLIVDVPGQQPQLVAIGGVRGTVID